MSRKVMIVESCGECPNYVRGRKHTLYPGGCKAQRVWFGTGVDMDVVWAGCPLEDLQTIIQKSFITALRKRGRWGILLLKKVKHMIHYGSPVLKIDNDWRTK